MSDGVHVNQLRYLSAALAFQGRGGLGSCTLRSVALALDLYPRLTITFGTMRAATDEEAAIIGPNASREAFIHCWLEHGDKLFAPTTIERTDFYVVPMSRASYYETNGVYDVRPVPRAKFDAIEKRFRLRSAFKHLAPRAGSGEVTEALLAAAGVRYRLGEHRGLLPLD